jgi:hypothetical protein
MPVDEGTRMIRFILVLIFFGLGAMGVLILVGVMETDSLTERLWSGILYTFMGIGAIATALAGSSSSAASKEYSIDVDDVGGDDS